MSDNYEENPTPLSPPPPPRSPYTGPNAGGMLDPSFAIGKLKVPAVMLIILTSLQLTLSVFSMISQGASASSFSQIESMMENIDPSFRDNFSDEEWAEFKEMMENLGPAGLVFSMLQLVLLGVTLFGAYRMMQGRAYPLALSAGILSSIPCFSPCCCLGMIPGIWSLVLLFSSEVREAFR